VVWLRNRTKPCPLLNHAVQAGGEEVPVVSFLELIKCLRSLKDLQAFMEANVRDGLARVNVSLCTGRRLEISRFICKPEASNACSLRVFVFFAELSNEFSRFG
jgi:hypothetical protein